MKTLQGKVAVVTGASRGIGKAIVFRLAQLGVNLLINSSSASSIGSIAEELAAVYGDSIRVVAFPGDVGDEETPAKLIAATIRAFGRLDILINNAGISGSHVPLCNTDTTEWDRVMKVNARAPFVLCREAVPYLRMSNSATIINITSTLATKAYLYSGAYVASKHALRGMTKVLAKELFEDGIRVHIVAPGGVDSEMLSTSPRADLKGVALSTPDELAEAVVFLLSIRETNMVIDEIKTHRCSKMPWM